MAERVDVAVVGGGVAGCATAIALVRLGITSVVLLEASASGRERVGETIPPDTRRLLDRLGVGAAFDAEGHAPCHGSASSWGADELGYSDHFVHPVAHGWHLDRRRFDAFLAGQAEAAGALRRTGARVMGVTRCREGHKLDVAAMGEAHPSGELVARLVVDATGLGASIGRRLGAERLFHDQLCYLACSVAADPKAPPSGQTWLEATSYGWWYAAQLPGGQWTVAVATDPEIARAEGLDTRDGFRRALATTSHVAARAGDFPHDGEEPRAWVASSSLLGPPAGEGWMAVGDAAAAYDPICARGIYKALDDGLAAAAAAREALAGRGGALAALGRRHIVAFRAYLEQRAFLYGNETRWPDAPFWKRRAERRNLQKGRPKSEEARLPMAEGVRQAP